MVREGAFAILSDYVFQDQPKLIERYVDYIFLEGGMDSMLAWLSDYTSPFAGRLPTDCGRASVFRHGAARLDAAMPADRSAAIARLLRVNGSMTERKKIWETARTNFDAEAIVSLAQRLDLFDEFSHDELAACEANYGYTASLAIAAACRWDYVLRTQASGDLFLKRTLEAADLWVLGIDPEMSQSSVTYQYVNDLFNALSPPLYSVARMKANSDTLFKDMQAEYISSLNLDQAEKEFSVNKYADIIAAYRASVDLPVSAWLESVRPVSAIVEAARSEFGECPGIIWLAGAGVTWVTILPERVHDLYDSSIPLCDRLESARAMSNDGAWWDRQVNGCQGECAFLLLYSFFGFADIISLSSHWSPIEAILSTISVAQYNALRELIYALDPLARTSDEAADSENVNVWPSYEFSSNGRMVALMRSRYNTSLPITYILPFLDSMDTLDSTLQPFILAILVRAAFDDELPWDQVNSLVLAAHKKDIDIRVVYGSGDSQELPPPLADDIFRSPSAYPLSFVRAADMQLRAQMERDAPTLREVAQKEGWFADLGK